MTSLDISPHIGKANLLYFSHNVLLADKRAIVTDFGESRFILKCSENLTKQPGVSCNCAIRSFKIELLNYKNAHYMLNLETSNLATSFMID